MIWEMPGLVSVPTYPERIYPLLVVDFSVCSTWVWLPAWINMPYRSFETITRVLSSSLIVLTTSRSSKKHWSTLEPWQILSLTFLAVTFVLSLSSHSLWEFISLISLASFSLSSSGSMQPRTNTRGCWCNQAPFSPNSRLLWCHWTSACHPQGSLNLFGGAVPLLSLSLSASPLPRLALRRAGGRMRTPSPLCCNARPGAFR